MSSASTLKDVYIEELRDLWSANDQMQRVMQSLSDKASDTTLKELLARSVSGIGQHTASLKSILEAQGGNVGKDHCKGMEGLVAEAKKHALEGEFDSQLRDIVIIAQYQRMSHYGLAGFGTAAAYANALGMKDDAAKLSLSGGVVVTKIQDGGVLGSQTNMRPGFIITKVGDQPVRSVDEFKDALSKQDSNFQIQGVYPDSKEVYYYGINDFKK